MKFEAEIKEGKIMNQGWRGKQSVHDRLQSMIDKTESECNGKFYKSAFMDFLITAGMDALEGVAVPGPATEKALNEIERIKPKAKRFVAPDILAVEAVFKNQGKWSEDAERFFNYYESNGWRVGKNPMKDWKAAARNWMKNNRASGGSVGKPAVDQSAFLKGGTTSDGGAVIDGQVIPSQQEFLPHDG